MKRSDLVAFVLMFTLSVALIFGFGYFGLKEVGAHWAIYGGVVGLTLLLGYLFARYALEPLMRQNEDLDNLLKETLHELNIPVATIKANTTMLKKRCNDPKSLKRLERIEAASNQLLGLYKEVDYFIKRRIKKEIKERFFLNEVIQKRLEQFEPLLSERRVKVTLEPLEVEASLMGFIKSFDNLLSNAIKYSQKDSFIEIELKSGKLKIKDEGEGIKNEDLVKVFERYYRASDKEGYGIGLGIVKNFCDEHSIKITIESKLKKGTTIILDLNPIQVS